MAKVEKRTTTALAWELGVSFRQLDYWLRKGLIPGDSKLGSGIPREWAPEQIQLARDLAVVSKLRGRDGKRGGGPDYWNLLTLVRNLRALGLDPLELAGVAGANGDMR